jgi:uncharacterized membrane protein
VKAARRILGLLFIFAGVMHFIRPDPYEAMMPDWIPFHGAAVYLSGVAEAAGGAALLSDRTARFGCWWLIAVLVAVFPANVHMALQPEQVDWVEEQDIPTWALWARLPFQAVFIGLIWLTTRRSLDQGANSPSSSR